MFFDIYWFLNGPRDILCHVQSPYKMSHLSPFTCQQNIPIPDVRLFRLKIRKVGSEHGSVDHRLWTIADGPLWTRSAVRSGGSLVKVHALRQSFSKFSKANGLRKTDLWKVNGPGKNQSKFFLRKPKILDPVFPPRNWAVLKFKIIVYWIFHDFEIFGRIGIFVGDQRASERTHVTWISNRISQNDYYIRTIIFIQKGNNFQRITTEQNKYGSHPERFRTFGLQTKRTGSSFNEQFWSVEQL